MLQAILTEDLSRAERLAVIDFHTGAGEFGAGQMRNDAPLRSAAHQDASALESPASGDRSTPVSVCPTGTLARAHSHWLPKIALTFTALKVGTLPGPAIFDLLRRDNWVHNFAQDQRLAAEIGEACQRAFCPDVPAWRRQAFRLAETAVQSALAGL